MATQAEQMAQYIELDSTAVAVDSYQLTPSDDTPLARPIRALRATTGGVVVCHTAGSGDSLRTLNFVDGETRNVLITHVLATGTTASGLEGMV